MFLLGVIVCFFFADLVVFLSLFFFFFNDTATTEIYTLSLHDALPIYDERDSNDGAPPDPPPRAGRRSEEHTSELQSRGHLVCRLLLEKKKKNLKNIVKQRKKRKQRKARGKIKKK